MVEQAMKVDTAQLHTGATRCVDAAGMALSGAARLAGKAPQAGIFGDFAEAQAFHQSVADAHKRHVDQLNGHHESLTAIGEKSHAAAATFTSTDESQKSIIAAAGAAFEVS